MNHNIAEHIGAFQGRLLKCLFNVPRCTPTRTLFKKLHIRPAKELMENTAQRILTRHDDIRAEYAALERRVLRDGSESLRIPNDNKHLREDFFTHIFTAAENYDHEASKLFKRTKAPSNLEITKWTTRMRRRVARLIQKAKSRRRR